MAYIAGKLCDDRYLQPGRLPTKECAASGLRMRASRQCNSTSTLVPHVLHEIRWRNRGPQFRGVPERKEINERDRSGGQKPRFRARGGPQGPSSTLVPSGTPRAHRRNTVAIQDRFVTEDDRRKQKSTAKSVAALTNFDTEPAELDPDSREVAFQRDTLKPEAGQVLCVCQCTRRSSIGTVIRRPSQAS